MYILWGERAEETLRQIQVSPKDEFGVSHVNVLFNPEADKVYCIIDAPSRKMPLKRIMINLESNVNGLWKLRQLLKLICHLRLTA